MADEGSIAGPSHGSKTIETELAANQKPIAGPDIKGEQEQKAGTTNDETKVGGPVTGEHTDITQKLQEITLSETGNGSAKANHHESTSTTAPNATVDNSTDPVLSPFVLPDPTTALPAAPTLSSDQQSKYDSLLATIRTWVTESPLSTPLSTSEQIWLTRECLLRYLRASKWALPSATTRLKSTLEWRRSYGVESHTAEYISEENATGKQVLLGYDLSGRPCLYLNPHLQNTKRSERQIEHLVFMLERCIDLMPPGVETLALLVNFRESRKGENATVGQGRQTISILQNHYPERLGRALVIQVPWLIWGFFKAIGPFIDPLTKEKLKFDEDLTKLVPPKQLLDKFGGDVKFEYKHDVYWPALNGLAEKRRNEARERWEKAGSRVGESELYLKGHGEAVPQA